MSEGLSVHGKFVGADVADIGEGATLTNGTGFSSVELKVWDTDSLLTQAYAAGEAGANGILDFNFVGSVDGSTWDTASFAHIHVTMNGATPVVVSGELDVSMYVKVRLQTIVNNDGAKHGKGMNVNWGKKYPLGIP